MSLTSDGVARTGHKNLFGTCDMALSCPFEVRDCGPYGIQLYLYRRDGMVRYSMTEIAASLDRHSVVPPKPLMPNEGTAPTTQTTENGR